MGNFMLALWLANAESTDGEVPESHWRTLVANQLDPGTGYEHCGAEGAALYEEFKCRLAALAAGEGMDFSRCLDYATLIGSRAIAHSFFRTNGGRFGLGPKG